MRGVVARGLRRTFGTQAAQSVGHDLSLMAGVLQKHEAQIAEMETVRRADRSDVVRMQTLLTRGFLGRLRWLVTGH